MAPTTINQATICRKLLYDIREQVIPVFHNFQSLIIYVNRYPSGSHSKAQISALTE